MSRYILHNADNLAVLHSMPDNSVDSIVTDPPYGLSFMGKKWDYDVPSSELWAECLRVLKPGGHLLAFAGTRTQHRMAVRIEDAGFEIRDMIAWVYGSGFPKSLDVSKAIDKSDPSAEAAHKWQGWGTALKPSLEPVTVARKPFGTTVAENVLTHGTGALNIDGCRVGTTVETWPASRSYQRNQPGAPSKGTQSAGDAPAGRWPANLIHDGSEEVVGMFPDSGSGSGERKAAKPGNQPFNTGRGWNSHNMTRDGATAPEDYGDSGSAARFFYCAKASRADRDEGCGDVTPQQRDESRKQGDPGGDNPRNRGAQPRVNHHPTVKPTDLMRYLCRLVTPPGGVVLDPFMGSGSTGKAAMLEGFGFIGIEREAEYVAIAERRIAAVCEVKGDKQMSLFGGTP